ncbi:MAG TPA: hypothetical protein VFA23_16955 [Dongiaceae bacterium]|nr:hypothetical protein [Dongiaceae bacterium]
MKRLGEKLARIRAGRYSRRDFIIADAKDPDMGSGLAGAGPHRQADGGSARYRTREEFLDQIRSIVRQDIVDVMLLSASSLDRLAQEGLFEDSAVQPAIRANDTTDIWRVRGGRYDRSPSLPFRSASLSRVMYGTSAPPPAGARVTGTDLGLYSVTFNNRAEADVASLEAFARFRAEAAAIGFRYFLEVFNPNVDAGIEPAMVGHYVNDCIIRCLAGVVAADRPQFLKIVYNGPRALEELAGFDPGLVVGVLGGGAGTTRDTFELLHQAERHGARVALFGRKINLAEAPLSIVALMRQVADGTIAPADAVKAYHAELKKQGLAPARALEDDLAITEPALKSG